MDLLRKIFKFIRNSGKKKNLYLIAFIIALGILLWAFITACVLTSGFNRDNLNNAKDNKKVSAAGIIITETKDGKKYFEIYGENGKYSNEESKAILHNVVGNFYKDNEVAMSFQSSKGSYDEKEGVITLYENTYIVLKDNTSLQANILVWSGAEKETIAEGNVIIKKSDEMEALADKCIISPGYEKFKIIGKTKTNIYGNKEK